MKLKLDPWDYIYMEMVRIENQVYRLSIEGTEMEVRAVDTPAELSPYLMGDNLIRKDILGMLSTFGDCLIHYNKGNFYYYGEQKGPNIFLGDIKYVGRNQYGGPILNINGKKCNTYKAISNELFGEIKHNSYVKAFIEPFLIEEKVPTKKADIKVEDFSLVKVNRYMDKYIPLISYKGTEYNGITNLKKAIPLLNKDKELLSQIYTHIGWDSNRSINRHDELIKKFDIEKEGQGYNLIDPKDPNSDISFPSQRKVIEFIKSHGESISRETAKRLFESL